MASLREILDRQKAEREKANAPKQEIKTEQPLHEVKSTPENEHRQTSVQGNQADVDKNGGKEIQRADAGLKKPLSLAEKIALRKKIPETQIEKPVEKSFSEKTAEAESINADKAIARISAEIKVDRQAEKTNDGVIDAEKLRNNLTYLANNIEQKELVGQIVRTIAVQIKQNPALQPFMSNADVDLFVRGMRSAYNIAVMKKQAAAEGKRKSNAGADELKELMKNAGLGGFNLKLNG